MSRSLRGARSALANWLVLASGVVAALHLGKAAIATPMLQTDMGMSLAQAGWLTSVFAVLGLLGGAPAGALAAVMGRRTALLLGLAIMALSGFAGTLVPSFGTLLVSRLLEGLGFLLVIVAGPAILERLATGAARDRALALWSCFMPCGMALAMTAGPFFSAWQWLWWSSSALALIAALAVFYCVPEDPRHRVAARLFDGVRRAWTSATVLLASTFALYSLMFFALFAFLPVLLMERMDVTYRDAGLLSALASAVNVSGNLAAGWLLARGIGRGALILFASATMGAAALGIFLGLFQPLTTFLLCLLFSAAGGLIPATLLASAPLVARESTLVPVVVGVVMQGSNLGQLSGPVLVGGVTAALGWGAAGWIVAAAAMITGAIALVLQATLVRNG
ncbi:MFS transporter [Stutzerimonas stutzeri]|jgi:predicted MFS family arabinose efflux permease|uniref:MFS transporter n=1 Tax=Stutzerimonas stutzeri TaxID=316 RepID=UPI000EE01030|nr:MFS transporter [Stutzerimonas stutzeri]HAG20654.1 MFS transporter [Pseudomonas sp.]MBH3352928.1 MFS transporter [Stutzerimonas stutzeri]MDH0182063.1 MFS transporter [Stutzerimonas stutzeri]MDH0426747.1 MFS transporter [Stutzerimonas stutzeri]MDH1248891.1 MFS transporter [Stutzerimonas stutzeri]